MKKIFALIVFCSILSADYLKTAQNACNIGDSSGCHHLGTYYKANGDIKKAITYFEKACYDKKRSLHIVGLACNDLGVLYGEIGDYTASTKYFRMACNAKNMRGCYNLGYNYDVGAGVEADIFAAEELYQKACYNKEYLGCGNLARILMQQHKPEQSKQVAELGCKNNDPISCYNLGVVYQYYHKDFTMARQFYKKACKLGDQASCSL